jgi:hypothetical protein
MGVVAAYKPPGALQGLPGLDLGNRFAPLARDTLNAQPAGRSPEPHKQARPKAESQSNSDHSLHLVWATPFSRKGAWILERRISNARAAARLPQPVARFVSIAPESGAWCLSSPRH